MRRIEIYGHLTAARTLQAESFCRRMNYAHILRNIAESATLVEMKSRNGDYGELPQIFIGDELIGSVSDLIGLAPFIVQQKIGG